MLRSLLLQRISYCSLSSFTFVWLLVCLCLMFLVCVCPLLCLTVMCCTCVVSYGPCCLQ